GVERRQVRSAGRREPSRERRAGQKERGREIGPEGSAERERPLAPLRIRLFQAKERALSGRLQPDETDERVAYERRALVDERLAVIPEARAALLVENRSGEQVREVWRGRFRVAGRDAGEGSGGWTAASP